MFSLRSLMALITWNTSFEANPESSDSPSYGDDEIRNLKTAMRERFEKGHTMNTAVGTVGPDGWHKSGSAKLYYQAAQPTTRPDGTTALTADDNGRRWVRSTDNREYVYVHPSWTAVTTLNGANNTLSGNNTFSGTNTFSSTTTFTGAAHFSNNIDIGGITITGSASFSDSIFFDEITANNGIDPGAIGKELRMKIISIGAWNMDTLGTVPVDTGIEANLVRMVSVMIQKDDLAYFNEAVPWRFGTAEPDVYWYNLYSTFILIKRRTGGIFDASGYSSEVNSRGYVTLWYADSAGA